MILIIEIDTAITRHISIKRCLKKYGEALLKRNLYLRDLWQNG